MIMALLLAFAAAALAGCALQEEAVENATGKIDVAKDAAVKAQLMMIKTGIEAQIATTGAAPADASQATLGGFVDPWPVNPFTEKPMQQGDAAGDYTYAPAGGASYTLEAHLSDGGTYTAP
jgi:hypothetical protein